MPLSDYLALVGVVFGVNMLPAFGPPTWAVLVFFRFNSDVQAVPLVLLGAIAAAGGRLALAHASRRLRGRLSERRRQSLDAAQGVLAGSRRRSLAGLAVFALSPVPSAQLFVAAGVMTVPLVPLTGAFFAGRLVSYAIYVGAASAAAKGLGPTFTDALTSPAAIAAQVAMLLLLVALLRVDWAARLARFGKRRDGAPADEADPAQH